MQGPPAGHAPAAAPQPVPQQQQQPFQQPPPPQYTNEKPTQGQGPGKSIIITVIGIRLISFAAPPEKNWLGEHKTELGVRSSYLGPVPSS